MSDTLLADERATAKLRRLLDSPRTELILEAHSGLSARIVEEAGFAGIWASGLAISASLGVRDANEVSWTQVLDVAEYMCDATSVPVLLDADTGYGNFNNVRRLVHKSERCGLGGICLEDKLFPKTNSFIGERQPLADTDEFAGKIAAAVDHRDDPDFCVVARTEALVSGWGIDEALRRAHAYHAAGADAVLIHSKASTAHEVIAFARAFERRCPVVIVPTTYADTPLETFEDAGVSVVIWANHLVRAAVTTMQEVASAIRRTGTPLGVSDRLAPVSEIFRLQDVSELLDAEQRYLPTRR